MAGIAFLRRLLMKEAMKKSKDASGIMSLNKNLVKDVEDTVKKWIESAKKQGQDIDKMGEQEIKYIVELNKPKAPTTLADMVEKLGLNDPKKNRFLQKEGQVIQADFGGGITDDVSEIIIKIKTMKPMDSMKEANKVLKGEGRYKSLSKADRKKIVDDESVTDHIFERNIEPDPEDFAQGGRTGSGLNYLLGEDDQNSRVPYKTGRRVIEENIAAGPQNELYDKGGLFDLAGAGVGISTIGLPKWLLSKISEKMIQGKIGKKFFNEHKDERMGEARQMLTAQDPYKGEEPWLSRRKEKYRSKPPEGGKYNIFYDRLNPKHPVTLAEGGRIGLKKGSKSWTDRIAGWTGGKNIMAGEIGLETWGLLNNLLQSGGLYAEGGRTGFGLGGMSKARRAFLKWLGAGAAGTAAAKSGLLSIFKGGATKSVIKDLTSVPIKAGADGMPLWFKPLVNKVIKEGDDVTKKFATADREIVHATKLPESQTDVIVTQDITTGNVSVDIGMGKHGFSEGHLGQPVRLEYKASEVIEPSFTKNKQTINKAGKTKEEFWVEEAEFTGGHPENIKFEESVSEKFGQHGSDFTEVEKFATGKVTKAGTKRFIGKPDPGSSLKDDLDFASGGRVPLAEGSTPSSEQLQQYYEEIEKQRERERLQRQLYEQRFGGPGPVLEASQGGLAGMLGE